MKQYNKIVLQIEHVTFTAFVMSSNSCLVKNVLNFIPSRGQNSKKMAMRIQCKIFLDQEKNNIFNNEIGWSLFTWIKIYLESR